MNYETKQALVLTGSDVSITREDLQPGLHTALLACSGPGDALPAVIDFLRAYDVEVSEENARGYLTGYGAWDEFELSDHATNIERLVWIIGCDLAEYGEACLSNYS